MDSEEKIFIIFVGITTVIVLAMTCILLGKNKKCDKIEIEHTAKTFTEYTIEDESIIKCDHIKKDEVGGSYKEIYYFRRL